MFQQSQLVRQVWSIDSPQTLLTQSSSDLVDESFHGRQRWILALFFMFFQFKVQITNLRHIHWKTPDANMFATPCTWSRILICLWDGFNSLVLHHVQTHNRYRLHSISPWFIPAWPFNSSWAWKPGIHQQDFSSWGFLQNSASPCGMHVSWFWQDFEPFILSNTSPPWNPYEIIEHMRIATLNETACGMVTKPDVTIIRPNLYVMLLKSLKLWIERVTLDYIPFKSCVVKK